MCPYINLRRACSLLFHTISSTSKLLELLLRSKDAFLHFVVVVVVATTVVAIRGASRKFRKGWRREGGLKDSVTTQKEVIHLSGELKFEKNGMLVKKFE